MDLGGFSEESIAAIEHMLDFADKDPDQLFIKAKKKKCPSGTVPSGAGYCKNRKPGKAAYVDANKKSCPPGTRPSGAGKCKVEYAEEPNPLEGKCNQKKLREANKKPQTPEQQQANRERSQEMQGRDVVPPAVRKQAAEKAAKTRSKCSGNKPATPPTP
jgi:hypothetical protein